MIPRHRPLRTIATLALLACAWSIAHAQQIDLRRTAENHLFLFGRLDERKTSVLVDTGWSRTTRIVPGVQSPGHTTNIARLQLGRVTLTNIPALAKDMRFNGQPASFGLVLGVDFLMRHDALLDCHKDKLLLRSTPLLSTNSLATYGFIAVPLQLKTNPLALTCVATINGERIELLVDSAAVWTCVDERTAQRLGLKPQPSLTRLSGAGHRSERFIHTAEVARLDAGGVVLKPFDCAVLDLADWGLAATNAALPEVHGILGGPELRKLRAKIDCGSLTLWVKP